MLIIDPVKLRDLIITAFDIEELNSLMLELGILRDDIGGQTITTRAEELIIYCRRRGRLDELLALCARLRPAINWQVARVAATTTTPAADPQREAARRELRAFKALLDEGWQTYLRHNAQRGRLWQLIHQNHAAEIPPSKGYDDLFYKMFDRLNEEEMELFRIVRGNTRVGAHRINGRIRDWADSHDIPTLFPGQSPKAVALEREVMELRVHLAEWFAKYEETFLPDPRRTLVYLGDEKRQGTRWPPGLNDAVAAMLEAS
jgi:hypothetical protein